MTPELREKMGEIAVKLAKKVSYSGAGTVEFIYENGKVLFLRNEHKSSSRAPNYRNDNWNRYCPRND